MVKIFMIGRDWCRARLCLAFCCSWLLLISSAWAGTGNLGVRAQSLGEAYRAVATANDIMFYNPAGLVALRRIGADADYLIATADRLHSLGVTVVDSKTTAWGMGLAYNAGINAQHDIATTHLANLALAMPLGTDQIALGAGFSYLYDPTDQSQDYRHFFNMDLGLLASLGAGLRFAVVADHLLASKGSEKSLGLSLGSSFFLGDITESIPLLFSFDWSMRDVKSDTNLGHLLGFGLQYMAYTMIPLRFGYKFDPASHQHAVGLGTGIAITGFSIDGLYQQDLSVGKSRQFGLAVRVEI